MAKTKARAPEEIQSEYARTCMEIGELFYRQKTIPGAIEELCVRALRLNEEHAAALTAKEKTSNG